MDRVLVRRAKAEEIQDQMLNYLWSTPDGQLFDMDVLEHPSTFTLAAFNRGGILGFLPIQRPLMLENLIFRPGLTPGETAQVIAKLGEHALEETIREDAGEAYFLCREKTTLKFAERHGFTPLPEKLVVRRFHVRENFAR
jgi:hypothetical protein